MLPGQFGPQYVGYTYNYCNYSQNRIKIQLFLWHHNISEPFFTKKNVPFLVRLEFEPLLLYSPFLLLLLLRFVKFFWLRLVLETWNLVHTLRGFIQAIFVKRVFWSDLNLYLYLMVWLEIGHLYISACTCPGDLKLGTHFNRIN